MLYFGFIFYMIFRMGSYMPFGMGYPGASTTIIIIGSILLLIGIILIIKGVSVYRSAQTAYYKNRAARIQPVTYTPASAPSYAPMSSPSYAPQVTPTVILGTSSSIQDPTLPKETMTPAKKYCSSCGAELPAHTQAHFCPTCGGAI